MNSKHTLLGIVLALVMSTSTYAQDIYLDASTHGKTIYTNGGTFYDSGRLENRYSNFEDLHTTICSSTGAPISIEFFEFFLEKEKDQLYISYGQGDDIHPVPGSPYSGESMKGRTITSIGSCLTFRMTTDFNIMRSGWDAEITVIEPLVIVND